MRLVLAAVLIGMALPASASATTWFYTPTPTAERLPIAEGVTIEVPLSSNPKFTLVLKRPKVTPNAKMLCTASGTAAFWNTPEGGRDETRSLNLTCTGVEGCPEPTVTTMLLAWPSTLLESTVLPLLDRWEGMTFDVSCAGADLGVFAGTMTAKVGDVDPESTKEKEGIGDLDAQLVWNGSRENGLTAANGDEVWLIGGLRMGGEGSGISDEAVDG
jgi:hypothetical protein